MLSHQVGDVFNVLSVGLLRSPDSHLHGQPASYRHRVGVCEDVQVVLFFPVQGDVWVNCDLLSGLLFWTQVRLCGLSLGNRQKTE